MRLHQLSLSPISCVFNFENEFMKSDNAAYDSTTLRAVCSATGFGFPVIQSIRHFILKI